VYAAVHNLETKAVDVYVRQADGSKRDDVSASTQDENIVIVSTANMMPFNVGDVIVVTG
jgi:hypothetical protein